MEEGEGETGNDNVNNETAGEVSRITKAAASDTDSRLYSVALAPW